jgi:hypothetical protein
MVLLTPRSDLTADERAAAIDVLNRLTSEIPDVQRFRIGRRVKHALPGYEEQMKEDYQLALILELEDLDALKRYLQAPAHRALGKLFSTATSNAIAYDYEIVDASRSQVLL